MQTARLRTHSAKIKTRQAKHALNQLHAELAGKIMDNKKGAERLRQAMEHVEAVIKLLDPAFNIRSIAIRRRKQNPWFKRGTLFRGALAILQRAEKPLTTNEIVTRMIAAKGVKEPSRDDARTVFGGVARSLQNHAGDSVIKHDDRSPARWSIKD